MYPICVPEWDTIRAIGSYRNGIPIDFNYQISRFYTHMCHIDRTLIP